MLLQNFPEPSGPPQEVEAEVLSSTSIVLSWQPPAIQDWNGIIDGYQAVLEDWANGERLEHEFVVEDCGFECAIEG